MRRSPVPLLLLLLASLLVRGGLTAAGSSAGTLASRAIVCPLIRGVIIPCCEPPVGPPRRLSALQAVGCCPVSILCAQRLTIASTPNPSAAGRPVVISGGLLGGAGGGAAIVLRQRLAGQQQFHVLLQTTTDAAGAYEIIRGAGRVQTNRQWYVTAGATRSRTLSQGVEAIVRLTAAAAKGPRRTFSGHVTPSHEGERILLQRLIAHGWSTIARPRLTRTSSFGATLRLAKGTSELRAVLPADERNLRSASRPVSVRTQ